MTSPAAKSVGPQPAGLPDPKREVSTLLDGQLAHAHWQEEFLERRSTQYDTGISSVLVVAGLVAAAGAAVGGWQVPADLASGLNWFIVAGVVAALSGACCLLVAALVRTKNDEAKVPWTASKTLEAPGSRLMESIDARSKALSDHLGRRRLWIYVGYGLTIIGAGCLIIFVVSLGIASTF